MVRRGYGVWKVNQRRRPKRLRVSKRPDAGYRATACATSGGVVSTVGPLVRTEDRSELWASSWQSPTLCATTNSVLGYVPTVSSLTSSYDSALWTVMTVLTGPI
jgi:hypothetical protein